MVTHRAVPPTTTGSHPDLVLPTPLVGVLADPALPTAASEDGLRVWSLDTTVVDLGELDEARGWFDTDEQDQAAAYVRAELRHAYEIAHAAARRIVAAALDIGPADIVWGRHPCPGCGEMHGRPRIEGSDLEFSLAHTPGLVLVAVADVPVGVDAERCPDPAQLSGLAAVLHPEEAAEVAAAHEASDPDEAVTRFTRAWTRTEAYLKGVGIGLGRDPQVDYLGTSADHERQLDGWRVRDVHVAHGYGAAVATVLHDGPRG